PMCMRRHGGAAHAARDGAAHPAPIRGSVGLSISGARALEFLARLDFWRGGADRAPGRYPRRGVNSHAGSKSLRPSVRLRRTRSHKWGGRDKSLMLKKIGREVFVRTHPFWGFLESDALAINKARLDHLASLQLPIDGKSVLEVGAGIGMLTGFFEDRGCKVLSTDARSENVAEIKRRHPARQVATLDLERPEDIARFDRFDIVFCYGTLYHLAAPEPALEALSPVPDMR